MLIVYEWGGFGSWLWLDLCSVCLCFDRCLRCIMGFLLSVLCYRLCWRVACGWCVFDSGARGVCVAL